MPSLFDIVVWIGTVIIFVSFIKAYLINKNKNIPYYLKGFYWCPLIALSTSANTIASRHLHLYSISLNFSIQNSLGIFDIVFWGIFFLKLFRGLNYKRYTIIIFIFFGFLSNEKTNVADLIAKNVTEFLGKFTLFTENQFLLKMWESCKFYLNLCNSFGVELAHLCLYNYKNHQ